MFFDHEFKYLLKFLHCSFVEFLSDSCDDLLPLVAVHGHSQCQL